MFLGGDDMTATFEAIGLGHLSAPERLEFIARLQTDIPSTTPVISEWKKEYARKLRAEARVNPNDWIDGEEFFAQLDKEFPE